MTNMPTRQITMMNGPDEEELDKVVVDNKTANNKTAEEVKKGQNSS
jgi:hypothetical protein